VRVVGRVSLIDPYYWAPVGIIMIIDITNQVTYISQQSIWDS